MEGQRRNPAVVSFLRLWLWGSGVALAALIIWVVAPVLFLGLALTAGIGVICAIVVKLARKLERFRPPERVDDDQDAPSSRTESR